MTYADRPTPAVISHKYRALVRHNQPAPNDPFEIVDYVVFNDEGTLVDILHHLSPVAIGLPDGEIDMSLAEQELVNLPSKSGVIFEFLAEGYEYQTLAIADYIVACAKMYPNDRAEWTECWRSVFLKIGIAL